MSVPQPLSPRVPAFAVRVNGTRLEGAAAWQISSITVEEHVDLPSMFTLELGSSDDLDGEAAWLDDDKLFAIGDEITIQLGYTDSALRPVITGEVTGLGIEWSAEGLPRMMVRGYDRRHRLQRGRRVRTFVKKKDSEIAAQIAAERGFSAQITDSTTIHDYIVQANQSDLTFLQERARRIHYEVVVEDRALHFHPVAYEKAPVLSLSIENELSEFRAELSSAGQVNSVTAMGWNVTDKKAVVGRASAYKRMGGQATAADRVREAFGEAEELMSFEPVGSLQEAESRATARLGTVGLRLVRGEGACPGRTDVRAGKVIEIKGIGKRFSGPYYVTAVSHQYNPEGYSTHFTAWRNST
ncbi:MAG: phage late control D family protein [Gammaproteobacteria bacterium]